MKILHIGKIENLRNYPPPEDISDQIEIVETPAGLTNDEYIAACGEADVIIVDAITPVDSRLIRSIRGLKMIHSEGVAYNGIDVETARSLGIYVCNCAGMNSSAVAEMALLLMNGMLRNIVVNDRAVREGRQIEVKGGYMARGDLHEMADMSVGLIGFGNIARKTAALLRAYGVTDIYYNKRSRLPEDEERSLGVRYMTFPDILHESDIISLHCPVTEQTIHMADDSFFEMMKQGSYFVNTSRGELVDDYALIRALDSGKLAMAGIDTPDHEPVQKDHPLLTQSREIEDRIIFAPHIGGITASSFKRGFAMVWDDVRRLLEGQTPGHLI